MKLVAFKHIILPEEEYRNLVLTKFEIEDKLKEEKNISFQNGVNHVFEKIKEAISKRNINVMLSISHADTNDLKLLVNGMLGKFVKRKQ